MSETLSLIRPDWPAPARVKAVVTTRLGGVSEPPYDGLNLGTHVADDPEAVKANRALLHWGLQGIAPCEAPQWLNQVHGTTVVEAGAHLAERERWVPDADAATTTLQGVPCVVMTADCLPVFFCDRAGSRVAVAHAGWRGLCDGVLEATLAHFSDPAQVLCWLGPAIGPQSFEVGAEVREAFVAQAPEAATAFVAGVKPGKLLADIYDLARLRLAAAGVGAVSGGGFDTVSDAERFFSYRRDGRTGRMASIIWLA